MALYLSEWTNLIPLYPRVLCGKFGWNWPNGSGEEVCWMLSKYFAISLLSPLGIVCDPTVEQTWKDALCQVWLKLAQWFWRKSWKCEKFTDRWLMDQSSLVLGSGKLKVIINLFMNISVFLQREITMFIECTCTPIFIHYTPILKAVYTSNYHELGQFISAENSKCHGIY